MAPWTNGKHCCHDTIGKQKKLLSWHHRQTESTAVMTPFPTYVSFHLLLPSPPLGHYNTACSWGSSLIYTKKQIWLDSQIYSCGFISKSIFILIVCIILGCIILMLDQWLTEIKLHTDIRALCRLKYTHAPIEV